MSGVGSGLRVLCTHQGIHADAIAALRGEGFEVAFTGGPHPQEQVLAALARAPVHAMLLRGMPLIDAAVFAAAPALRILSCHGAGYDSIDVALATRRGVLVTTSGGSNALAVAEHAFAMIVMLARRIPQLDADVRRGEWAMPDYLAREFCEITVGLVGFGRIARRTATLCGAAGMRVIAFSRTPGSIDNALAEPMSSLEALAGRADIISLHTPLNEVTRGMVDHTFIARVKPGAMLVNTARGGLVQEDALAMALTSGHIGGAAVDTLAEEPPAPQARLLGAPNLTITPHIAALTAPAMARMGATAASNIIRLFADQPLDPKLVINPQALEGRAR
jgi:D-3-phosphoglycerate dehydrogenase